MTEENGDQLAGIEELREVAGRGPRYKLLSVPGLGKVRIRNISAYEQLEINSELAEGTGNATDKLANMMQSLIAVCWVDCDGKSVVPKADRGLLKAIDGATSQMLFNGCLEHCQLTEGDLEDTVKNLEAAAGD